MSAAFKGFVDYLATLPPEQRTGILARAELLADNADPDANEKFAAAPQLQSAAELADQRKAHRTYAEEMMRNLYGDDFYRLAADDPSATAARTHVANKLLEELPIDSDEAEKIVRTVAAGGTGDPFTILDSADDAPVVPPKFHIQDRIYEERFHQFHGKPGSNKSILVLYYLLTLASRGVHVIMVQYEMGKDMLKEKIDELGFVREDVRPYFHDVAPNHPFDADMVGALMARWPETKVLALDNTSEAMTSQGADSNSDNDTIRVLGPLRDLAHHKGVATIVIDHLPHSRKDTARGSTAKEQILDVAYSVETPTPVTREREGNIKLVVQKDRPSRIGVKKALWYKIGDGEGNLPISISDDPGGTYGWSQDEEKIVTALREYAEQNPDSPKLSRNSTLSAAGIKYGQGAIGTLDKFAAEDGTPVQCEIVPQGSRQYFNYWYEPVEDLGIPL